MQRVFQHFGEYLRRGGVLLVSLALQPSVLTREARLLYS